MALADEKSKTLRSLAKGACELQEKDGPTRARIQAVRLYGLGFAVPTIHTITGLSRSRLMQCCHAYQQDGITALHDHRAGGNNRKLTVAQQADLEARLHQYTPRSVFGPEAATPTGQFWTLTDLQAAVKRWYGVTYTSTTSYYTLFARCGFTAQRPDQVFKSRRTVAVLDWEAHAEKN
jgi:transposase